jgi:hypothetical protein
MALAKRQTGKTDRENVCECASASSKPLPGKYNVGYRGKPSCGLGLAAATSAEKPKSLDNALAHI